ncbi:MAG: hypothetical protein R2712_16555 [Vicinamibacterales bacterium]
MFGNAEVSVFRDSNYRGDSRLFTSNINDLRRAGLNDRITSIRVDPRGSNRYNNGGWGAPTGRAAADGADTPAAATTTATGAARMAAARMAAGGRTRAAAATRIARPGDRAPRVSQRPGPRPRPAAQGWVNTVMQKNMSQRQLEAELRRRRVPEPA